MRRSSIEVRRQSKNKTLNYPSGSHLDASFDSTLAKTNLGERIILRKVNRGVTQIINPIIHMAKSSTQGQNSQIFHNQGKDCISHNIPEYEFLKNKEVIKNDPFLKAKMKYLLDKQKPNLISQIPKVNTLLINKKNTSQMQKKQFTTLKSQNQKQKSKKLSLLVNANATPLQPSQ